MQQIKIQGFFFPTLEGCKCFVACKESSLVKEGKFIEKALTKKVLIELDLFRKTRLESAFWISKGNKPLVLSMLVENL